MFIVAVSNSAERHTDELMGSQVMGEVELDEAGRCVRFLGP